MSDDSQLLDSLSNPLAEIRIAAATTLKKISYDSSANPFINSLQDSVAEVRMIAASALSAFKGVSYSNDGSIRALKKCLKKDSDWRVREQAAFSLGKLSDYRAVNTLGNALKMDAEVKVRYAAAVALGNINDISAASYLQHALDDENKIVREAAYASLKGHGME